MRVDGTILLILLLRRATRVGAAVDRSSISDVSFQVNNHHVPRSAAARTAEVQQLAQAEATGTPKAPLMSRMQRRAPLMRRFQQRKPVQLSSAGTSDTLGENGTVEAGDRSQSRRLMRNAHNGTGAAGTAVPNSSAGGRSHMGRLMRAKSSSGSSSTNAAANPTPQPTPRFGPLPGARKSARITTGGGQPAGSESVYLTRHYEEAGLAFASMLSGAFRRTHAQVRAASRAPGAITYTAAALIGLVLGVFAFTIASHFGFVTIAASGGGRPVTGLEALSESLGLAHHMDPGGSHVNYFHTDQAHHGHGHGHHASMSSSPNHAGGGGHLGHLGLVHTAKMAKLAVHAHHKVAGRHGGQK